MMRNAATEVNPGAAWRKHRPFSPFSISVIVRVCPVPRITGQPGTPRRVDLGPASTRPLRLERLRLQIKAGLALRHGAAYM